MNFRSNEEAATWASFRGAIFRGHHRSGASTPINAATMTDEMLEEFRKRVDGSLDSAPVK